MSSACAGFYQVKDRFTLIHMLATKIHHGIVAIHPAIDANGRIARSLARDLCYFFGFSLTSDEVLKFKNPSTYIQGRAVDSDWKEYDEKVQEDFKSFRPYELGCSNLSTNNFSIWLSANRYIENRFNKTDSIDKPIL